MLLRRSQPSVRQLRPDPITTPVSGPMSPLERNPQSPKGWKNRESDGVGLGIVAALERSDSRKVVFGAANLHVSAPVPIGSPKGEFRCGWRCRSTSGGDCRGSRDCGFFCGSPPPRMIGEDRVFSTADFLSYCYLCRKRLHGKDIYMYRGEKAFCSMECRYQQIVSDEFQEKCGSEALRPSDISSTSYNGDRLFFTGIAAA